MADRRQELFTLFRNTAKVAPSEACAHVAARLQSALTAATPSVQVRSARGGRGLGFSGSRVVSSLVSAGIRSVYFGIRGGSSPI